MEYIQKTKAEEAKTKQTDAHKKAEKLIKRFGEFREELHTNGIAIPTLYFSCDSGYSSQHLATCCQENYLIYISVPKKSHCFVIDNQTIKLSDWIRQVYLPAEKAYYEEQKRLGVEKIEPFVYRFKGWYKSQKMAVTLIAFRLSGSKKVSIVYSTSSTIFGKTMRRHWFQRTYIEQFFKILKHVLKIHETRTRDKDGFTFKLLRFFWLGLQAQFLLRYIRKKIKFRNKGFIYIQRIMRNDLQLYGLLQTLLQI